jgi:hypothetical protein
MALCWTLGQPFNPKSSVSLALWVRIDVLSALTLTDADLKDTIAKFRKEASERKRLHNELQDLRGNIRVFCRVRPLAPKEKDAGRASAVYSTPPPSSCFC